MTRKEAMDLVDRLVADFSADDVKDWLAETCTREAGKQRRAGNVEEGVQWMHFANDVAAVRNRGV